MGQPKKKMSLQHIVKQRQEAGFVGREDRLIEFRANLDLPIVDRRFLFNIHGDAGVGKTFLIHQLRRIAEQRGTRCAYLDESCYDVPEALAAIAADFARSGVHLSRFERRYATYRQRRHELDVDPQTPAGLTHVFTKGVFRVGLHSAKLVPVVGAATELVDPAAAAEQLDRFRAFLGRKFRGPDDVTLVLSPAEALTPVFVEDLYDVAQDQTVALFIDTYERTGTFLDSWFLDLLAAKYGELPADLVLVIAGRSPLDAGNWSSYHSIIADVPLTPFTDTEARMFLARQNVVDTQVVDVILQLSGRLPLLVAMLAEGKPSNLADIGGRTGDAVERFLKWETDERRRATALAGALPRRLNEDLLAAVCDGGSLFDWLRCQPFIAETAGGWQYHDVARMSMVRFQRSTSPQLWRAQHRRLAEYYRVERATCGVADEDGWADPAWQDQLVEESYHRLCGDGAAALPAALSQFVFALNDGTTSARRWIDTMVAAGRDSDSDAVQGWGARLSANLSDQVGLLTTLLESGELESAAYREGLLLRGDAYRRAERFLLAIADFDKVLSRNPDSSAALARRGEVHWSTGSYENALIDFTRAIELDPKYGWAVASRAYLNWWLGRYETALGDFKRALELNPGYHWSVTLPGDIYRRIGRSKETLAKAQRMPGFDVSDAFAALGRGEIYWLMGRNEDALGEFDSIVKREPNFARAISNRGETLFLLGRYSEAIVDVNRAIELDPDSSYQQFLRGALITLQGQQELGRAEIRKAIDVVGRESRREPAEVLHLCHLTVYLAALGEWSEARNQLRTFLGRSRVPWFAAHALFDLRQLFHLPEICRDNVVELIEEVERSGSLG
ncbi:tetratricopeptide repeat protein [Kibdelosporangium philippinense]|uniref:Tetratricopeptide repeat protein n=1 Tax=Kibdelosporangium philippinense TaxID=211113 RepID=A0ABS8ZTQ5_9PSEU|nr:tetratricopeptide repeat protein [Kibdelosporangium philippinense]MCE7011091.1 tetratricopeptide repeat protein [Kibdelosporangium philippinense]